MLSDKTFDPYPDESMQDYYDRLASMYDSVTAGMIFMDKLEWISFRTVDIVVNNCKVNSPLSYDLSLLINWCNEKFKPNSWVRSTTGYRFFFNDPDDALLFKLTWM